MKQHNKWPVAVFLTVLALLSLGACRQNKPVNTTSLQQINIDNSNNYFLIFKERIDQEREAVAFQKENEFFD